MSITIFPKRSGSKSWGWATGPGNELAHLARQLRVQVKPSEGDRPAHVDLTPNQVKRATKKGAQVE